MGAIKQHDQLSPSSEHYFGSAQEWGRICQPLTDFSPDWPRWQTQDLIWARPGAAGQRLIPVSRSHGLHWQSAK